MSLHVKNKDEVFNAICTDLSSSNIGLHHLCKKHGISHVTFYEWIKDVEMLNKYTRAREQQADFLADEIIQIADDSSNDTKTIIKGDEAIEVENTEWTNRSKLRVEARKWIAAKLKPKKYGDKVEIDNQISINKLPDWLNAPIENSNSNKSDS